MPKNTKKNAQPSNVAARNRYNAKTYDEFKVRAPKGSKAILQKYAEEYDTSVNALFIKGISYILEAENNGE